MVNIIAFFQGTLVLLVVVFFIGALESIKDDVVKIVTSIKDKSK